MPYKKEKKDCVQSDGDKGKYVLSYTTKKGEKRENCHTSEKNMQGQIAAIEGGPVDEKKKKRPGSPAYYKGTRKSNKEMAREINKCAKEPRPKSCYEDWDADKTYRKSKKKKVSESELNEMIRSIILDERKKKGTLSDKTKKTLKAKAKKANAPAGALYSVYRRGLGAWLTGHRQGVSQHQWAMGRVNSFISGKGGARKADKDLWEKVKKHRAKKRKNESVMSEALAYHRAHGKGVDENIFRPGSDAFFDLFVEARRLFREGNYDLSEKEAELLLGTDIGEWADYNGNRVPLHWPMENQDMDEAVYNGDDVKLRDPKRGGSKKFYVYVNSGKKTKDGEIKAKKVEFGDPNMKVRISDPERRASFAARHRCTEKDDETKPGYWSCRLGRYPHLTGSKKKYTWW